uniref:DUF3108 domain-containing protein n=1 Tax=Geobacter sp. (strain M21) TaxID=443144 RepID=C6E442_GEOSM
MTAFFTGPLPAQGSPIPVRFAEGMVRGFLELSDADGKRIASGDFLQVPRGGELKCRTVLYFKDGSLHDESAVFTQERNFLMKSYRLIQKGKSFKEEMEVSLDRAGGGKYRVAVGKKGQEKVLEGTLELPLDVYNGMVPTVLKNLPKGAGKKIHMVAFTPAPRVIELDMVPDGEDRVLVGDLEKSADHYVLKPKLGLLKLPAALLGRTPPDNHIWTITKEVPAFVRFTGPLALGGPIWRIELASPRWPK